MNSIELLKKTDEGDLKINIRPAKKNDCPEIARLIKDLAEYQNLLHACKITTEKLIEDGFGETPYFQCIVAELDNQKSLVGYLLFYKSYSSFVGRSFHIEDIYVDPEYRRLRIGERLIQTLAKKAIKEKYESIDLLVLTWNEESIKFYQNIGAKNLTGSENWYIYKFGQTEMNNLIKKLP